MDGRRKYLPGQGNKNVPSVLRGWRSGGSSWEEAATSFTNRIPKGHSKNPDKQGTRTIGMCKHDLRLLMPESSWGGGIDFQAQYGRPLLASPGFDFLHTLSSMIKVPRTMWLCGSTYSRSMGCILLLLLQSLKRGLVLRLRPAVQKASWWAKDVDTVCKLPAAGTIFIQEYSLCASSQISQMMTKDISMVSPFNYCSGLHTLGQPHPPNGTTTILISLPRITTWFNEVESLVSLQPPVHYYKEWIILTWRVLRRLWFFQAMLQPVLLGLWMFRTQ